MQAFLSNLSACEVLRHLGGDAGAKRRWPQESCRLPRWGASVSTQGDFASFAAEHDLKGLGALTAPVHLLVPDANAYSRGKLARFHVWKKELPVNAFLQVQDSVFVSTPEFVLAQMGGCNFKAPQVLETFRPELRAIQEAQAIIDPTARAAYDDPISWARKERVVRMACLASEFAGAYRLPVGDAATRFELPPLTSCMQIRQFVDGIDRLYGRNRVRLALDFAFDRSASPMETALALMLAFPVEYGGYGLARPELNKPLPCKKWARLWDGGDHITPDLLWEDAHLVLEYDSDEAHAGQGPRKVASDATRANVLTAMGYTVLRATTGNVTSLLGIDRAARQVAAQLGVTVAEADDITLIRRHKLHTLLMCQ